MIVLRVFGDPDIIHVENSVDPARDMEIINSELILKDLEAVEKRFGKVEAEARTGKKEAIQDKELLARLKKALEDGILPISDKALTEEVKDNIRLADLNLLTLKRQIYLLNGNESDIPAGLLEKINAAGADFLVIDLSSEETASGGVPALVKKAYDALGLISFFTTGRG